MNWLRQRIIKLPLTLFVNVSTASQSKSVRRVGVHQKSALEAWQLYIVCHWVSNKTTHSPIASHGLSFIFDEICEPVLGLYHNKHTKKNWHPSVRMNRKRPKKYLKRVLDHDGMEISRVLHGWVRICTVTSKKTYALLLMVAESTSLSCWGPFKYR